ARLHVSDEPLPEALTRLQLQSGASIAFSPSVLAGGGPVSCDCVAVTVRAALDRLLARTRLRYVELGEHIVIERVREMESVVRLASIDAPPLDFATWNEDATVGALHAVAHAAQQPIGGQVV